MINSKLVEELQHKVHEIERRCYLRGLLKKDLFNISTTTDTKDKTKQLISAVCNSIQNAPKGYGIFLEILHQRPISMGKLVKSIDEKVRDILKHGTVKSKPRPPTPPPEQFEEEAAVNLEVHSLGTVDSKRKPRNVADEYDTQRSKSRLKRRRKRNQGYLQKLRSEEDDSESGIISDAASALTPGDNIIGTDNASIDINDDEQVFLNFPNNNDDLDYGEDQEEGVEFHVPYEEETTPSEGRITESVQVSTAGNQGCTSVMTVPEYESQTLNDGFNRISQVVSREKMKAEEIMAKKDETIKELRRVEREKRKMEDEKQKIEDDLKQSQATLEQKEKEIEALRKTHEQEKKELEEQYQVKIKELHFAHAKQSELARQRTQQLQLQLEEKNTSVVQLQHELEEAKKKHEEEIAKEKKKYEDKVNQLQRDYDGKIAKLEDDMEKQQLKHELAKTELKVDHNKKLSELQLKAKSLEGELETQRAEMKAQSAEMKAQHAEMKAQSAEMRAQHAEVRAQHAEEQASMITQVISYVTRRSLPANLSSSNDNEEVRPLPSRSRSYDSNIRPLRSNSSSSGGTSNTSLTCYHMEQSFTHLNISKEQTSESEQEQEQS